MDILQHTNAQTFNLRVRDFLRRNEALRHSPVATGTIIRLLLTLYPK